MVYIDLPKMSRNALYNPKCSNVLHRCFHLLYHSAVSYLRLAVLKLVDLILPVV